MAVEGGVTIAAGAGTFCCCCCCASGIGGGSSFMHAFSSMFVHFPLVP